MVVFNLPPLKEGMSVETSFIAGESASSVNLQKDNFENLMIHIRVDQNRLVFNSRNNGAWGGEESFSSSGIGVAGTLVILRVEARSDHFYVTINRKDTYNFKYRLPYTDVNMCNIGATDIKHYTVFYPSS